MLGRLQDTLVLVDRVHQLLLAGAYRRQQAGLGEVLDGESEVQEEEDEQSNEQLLYFHAQWLLMCVQFYVGMRQPLHPF